MIYLKPVDIQTTPANRQQLVLISRAGWHFFTTWCRYKLPCTTCKENKRRKCYIFFKKLWNPLFNRWLSPISLSKLEILL